MGAAGQGFELRHHRRAAVRFTKEAAFETERLIRADNEPAWLFPADCQGLGPGKMKSDAGGVNARRHERRFDPAFIYRGGANLERYPGGAKKALAGGALRGENKRRRATPKPCHDVAMNFNW
jgi:hypothetical protein